MPRPTEPANGAAMELATMENKLKALALAAFGFATIGLASCSDIEATLPENVDNAPILNVDGIVNNNMGEIYDALVTAGDTNSERVLNNVLALYSKGLFGEFYGEGGMLEAIESDDLVKAYAAAHPVFGEGDEAVENCRAFINHIIDSVNEQMWSIVENSTYQRRSIFLEKEFYRSQVAELYDLKAVESYKEVALDGEKDYRDVEEYFTDMYVTYEDYIERSILPAIYRDALVEQYIIENNYGVLGRSYARKVQFIALPNIESDENATRRLVTSYAKLVLANAEADAQYRDLHFLDRLYKGYITDPEEMAFAQTIYTDAEFSPIAKTDDTVATYRGTTYGDIAFDYNGLSDDRNVIGSTTDFTNSGAYTKEVGLEIKTRETVATSHVTEGWYTSSGLSELASSISTRLFKITVANEVDREGAAEENAKGNFGWYVNGSYYMVPETYESNNDVPYCIYDKDSSTWYIVRVDEAVKAPKLVFGGDSSYETMEGKNIYDIVYSVAGLVSGTQSYRDAANQHYVEKMAISYHDQTIYDYFEATFPDLFD